VRISVNALTADNSIAKNAVRYVASIETSFRVMRSHDRFRKGRARPALATLFPVFSGNGGYSVFDFAGARLQPSEKFAGFTLLIGRRQYFPADREFFANSRRNRAHTGGRAMALVGRCRNSGDLE
jgi:hypothetical protein